MSNFFLRAANRLFGDFVQRRRDRILNSRRAQQEYDTQRLYLLTEFRKQLDELKRKGESFPEHMPLPSQDQLPILELQMETLQQSVSDQLVHTLDAVHENCGVLTDVHHGQQKIQEKLGFCTSVKTSTANGAGNGLFLQGDALPGTVVGFHPGIVYLLLDLNKLPNFPHVDKENPYLFSRLDGAVLDAKGWEILLKRDPNHPRFSDVTSHYVDHPFAKGHLINHPPKDIRPNVMQYSFDIPVSFPPHLIRYIPNVYYRKPGLLDFAPECIMKTIVFVTKRQVLDGEELFVDYRYNPKNKYPDWYHPVDEQENARRWTR